eukprot:CAMPEP_0117485114 /NCGR_PEP_ID=MMETSP0784-20121206/14803_1 /TAXON_ID=39447 /ORGANISM="" /LENGTH=143 /DNA_ID=CAMNT_0005279701 /DNA_START=46 /DNA_END=477 /DNA_ORIENTATION=+
MTVLVIQIWNVDEIEDVRLQPKRLNIGGFVEDGLPVLAVFREILLHVCDELVDDWHREKCSLGLPPAVNVPPLGDHFPEEVALSSTGDRVLLADELRILSSPDTPFYALADPHHVRGLHEIVLAGVGPGFLQVLGVQKVGVQH